MAAAQTLTYAIGEVSPYINWQYFFHAWQFPSGIAADVIGDQSQDTACSCGCAHPHPPAQVEEGRRLYHDAQSLLQTLDEKQYVTRCRYQICEANASGDDIIIYRDNQSQVNFPCLRQQHDISPDRPNLCISDFIRPVGQGQRDKLGVFAASVDGRIEQLYPDDPYLHMLAETLGDRLAEATADLAHQQIRRHYWGYAPDEHLTVADLHASRYQGIRPAVGYSSLPDVSLNHILDRIIDFSAIGIRVLESGMMIPHGSVSGLMISHPRAQYFILGPIGDDQLADYARRRGRPVEVLRKYLSHNLA